ncbi:MAG: RNA-binding protein [Bdellovibrionales bacterium]|nr:RNA-binding protein [Bdellovibrionales bacterium]
MGKKLYVGNLSYSTSDASLTEVFTQAGQVASARVIMDRESGRSKGFGFVEMATDEEAANALKMFDGQVVDGRPIRVSEAKDQAPGGGGGGGRGFGGGGGYGGGYGRGSRY